MSICELCDGPLEMKFTAVVPTTDGRAIMVKGNICLCCFSDHPSDTAIAVALLTKRKERQEKE